MTTTPVKDFVTKLSFRRRRARSAPPTGRRRTVLEEHYRVDSSKKAVLPGVPKHDHNSIQESHDFFNLIVLIPIVVLNAMNWNWDILLDPYSKKSVQQAWTGEWFEWFWLATFLYFIIDLIWVMVLPTCVKSPGTIIKHHVATLLYIFLPYLLPHLQWAMGACMSVEANTWLLIARRVFNREGFQPWVISLPPLFSIRVKLISIFFYFTWITIRCILYPYLWVHFVDMYKEISKETGSNVNYELIVVLLHTVFCILNFKWSYDLLMSKIRYWRGQAKSISKGL